MAKISEFIIGMIFVSFFVAIFGLFIAEMNTNYGTGAGYDNESIATYNKLTELSNLSEEIKEKSDIQEEEGLLDIIGGYFSSGYKALKLTAKSFDIFGDMSEQALEDSGMGIVGQYFKMAISAALIIIIFLGILISAILKWKV